MAFNILVVDDSETMRAVIKKTVKMCGVDIGVLLEAENGRVALDIMANEWVDVVLSDINMPEMGGVEFLKEVKNDRVLKNVPVIFISTESSQVRIDEARKIGVAAYVKKPFVAEHIREVLLDVLNKAYATRIKEESGSEPTVDDACDF
ncbi:MAG: response regulator [Deltaproteobacteria bacterium]|nr:response regulator [Deltaproteobacteria bacterium]